MNSDGNTMRPNPAQRSLTMRLRALLPAAIAGALLLPASAGAEKVTLLSVDNAPPFAYAKDKAAAGIYLQIIQEALTKVPGYEVEVQALPARRAFADSKAGKAIGVYPVAKGQGPEEVATYSSPLLNEQVVVVCGDKAFDESARKAWPADYLGMTIGRNVGGVSGGAAFDTAITEAKVKLDEARETRSNMQKLFAGRIDCYLTENLAFLIEMKAMAAEKLYDPAQVPPFSVGASVATQEATIGYRADDKAFPWQADFTTKLDAALAEMKKSGRIDVIIAEFLR